MKRDRDRERLGYDESKGGIGWVLGGFLIVGAAAAMGAVLLILDLMKG